MSKVITGTKALKQQRKVRVHKATGSIQKIRCTVCRSTLVHPSPDGRGGTTKMKCGNCGAEFRIQQL